MSYWNHRVFKENANGSLASITGDWFTIREVYYNNDGSICAYGNPQVVEGDSIESLRQTLQWMLNSLDAPILSEDAITLVDYPDEEDDEEDFDDYDMDDSHPGHPNNYGDR